jgi:flagellum-specific ATP synthase
MDRLVGDDQRAAAAKVRGWLATYERQRHLVELGAWERGADPELDRAVSLFPRVEEMLRQGVDELATFEDSLGRLRQLVASA